MKSRLLMLCFLMLIASGTMNAQNTTSIAYTVKGLLLDSLTREGEPYATIKIAKKSVPNEAIRMAVTDTNGKFREKIPGTDGTVYVITLSSVGKAPVMKEFTLISTAKEIDLGELYIAESTNELAGVEVVAQKPLVKVDVDKIAYNIEDDPDSKTNSVLEMLRKVPLVTVDGEDNIKVNGSSNFKVHVNGKPNSMMSNNPTEVLKSMPANTIKHIEVITNPGAKYDAEGVGGILNIVTVDGGIEGYTATFRGNATSRGGGGGAYATVKKGKLTVTANYNYNHGTNPKNYSDSYRENFDSETEKYLETNLTSKYTGNFQYGSLETSYEIDTLRLLTLSFGMYGGRNSSDTYGPTTMYNANRDVLAYKYFTNSDGDGSWYSIHGNVDYQRTSRKNKERMLTLSYKINSHPQSDDSYSTYTDRFQVPDLLKLINSHTDGKTNSTEHTFQVDFTTPIGKLHTIETGVKYILRNNISNIKFYETSPDNEEDYQYNVDRSNHYKHLSQIMAAYVGYTLRYKTFTFKPGLRYEHTNQRVKYIVGKGDDFSMNLDDVVPSASVGLKLSDTQNIRGGYNMRIWRPGIWFLNPYFDDRNPMFITQGNSRLESEKSHSFDLSYSNFTAKYSINVSLRQSFNNNGIVNVSHLVGKGGEEINGHQVPEGAMYSTYENTGKNKSTGLSLYANWNASSKARIYLNGDGSYTDIKSKAQGLHNYGWNGSVHAGVQYTLPGEIRLSLNGGGSTPYIELQGKSNGYYYYSMGLNRAFMKERLTLSMGVNNIFEKYHTYGSTTVGENFLSKSNNRYNSRYVVFSINYRIGELKASVKKAARTINNDDVKAGGSGAGNGGGE